MKRWLILLLGICLGGMTVNGEEFRGLPESVPSPGGEVRVQDELRPDTQQQARKAFKPVEASVPTVRLMKAGDGREFVLLPVNFMEGTHRRVYWDVAVKADWSAGASVIFDFIAGPGQDVMGMYLFLHSVNGWYVASFGMDQMSVWNRIRLRREAFVKEGQPQGWNQIDRIRISCWKRSDSQDGWLGLANLGISRDRQKKPVIAIIRGDSCQKAYASESTSFSRYAETLMTSLTDCDIPATMLSDEHIDAKTLRNYKLVAIPHNPSMPEKAMAAVEDYLAHGGKVMGFFVLPQKLQKLLQISYARPGIARHPSGGYGGFLATRQALPGQPAFVPQPSYCAKVPDAEGRRVLATWANPDGSDTRIPAIMLIPQGVYVSHVWQISRGPHRTELLETLINECIPLDRVQRTRERLKLVGGQDNRGSLKMLQEEIRESGHVQAMRHVQKARRLRSQAKALLAEGNWQKAMPVVQEAADAADTAYFLIRPCKRHEERLVWCHRAEGVVGWNWDRSITLLADCGFTGIMVNMCWAGAAFYNSKVLPRMEGNHVDCILQCVEACRKHGLDCHVWKVCFNMGNKASKDFEEKMVQAGRVQVSRDGAVKRRWLCPSHPLNQQDEIETMVELARNYPGLAGVHFDYIRYSDPSVCFCQGCRQRFESYLKRKLTVWPFDAKDAELTQQWQKFRRRAISRVVQNVHKQVKRLRPNMKISAAVFSNWPEDRDAVGQDWGRWCRKGWLDFVCPMNYRENDTTFWSTVRMQKKWTRKAKLFPGIGLSCWENANNPFRLVRQIECLRKLGVGGFAVFNYDRDAIRALEWCGMGCTKE